MSSLSEGLLAEFPPYDDVLDPVDRVLLPRADIATETLSAGLRERGWEIDDVTAYRTVRAAPPPAETREMIKTGGFDAVCFTSSSTVRNLVGIAGKPHTRTLVACIGPKTAETAVEFGLRVDVQPEKADVPHLVDALAEHAARLRAEGALPPPRKAKRRRAAPEVCRSVRGTFMGLVWPCRCPSWHSGEREYLGTECSPSIAPAGSAPPRPCAGWWVRRRCGHAS